MQKIYSVILLLLFHAPAWAQNNPVGIFQNHTDIGNPKMKGGATYDAATQTYQIKGGGSNIWFNRDEFHYLYNKIQGDFILTANFAFVGEKGDPHRKIGWMVRESADEAAASMNAVVHGDGLTVLQWRPLRGAYMRDPQDEIFYPKKTVFQIVQLERSGKKMIMRVANWGEPLQEVGSHDMPDLPDAVLAGLFISSHNPDDVQEAKVWNVRIDKPVASIYHPNPQIQKTLPKTQDVLGCRLETMTIADGKRKVILDSPTKLEAPNWMLDGKKLLYNAGGFIYTIPANGGTPEKLNTGSVSRINNDHGIAFDNKQLAISGGKEGTTGGSYVYVLPLAGGTPKLVTQESPSYWHGWATNHKEVVLVGQRNGSKIYNIYRANVSTGKEVALTQNTTGHVDGPEYSPDGKYIYYNANPTGTMQIWRMKPDGSGKEQMTFDENHNWFPHISPDGKWIAYISFPTDIDPNSHPSYQRVTLRLMPTAGGAPRVIAYLYGGQGTINVNSWSPDSKSISFVSNSEKAEAPVAEKSK
ncbi:PD40 domain-containing protein [Adhaeribacter swui]|uniref:PD40 domain-containing protein n=1 Tax=Adhaeribacter swui TaxID=2086471 RepID=A0A7G7G8B2_9BACT|nr:PD40 domain-containing protein [Adhaeribacter swui]QNF33396.1 PD40 domain-containing protein [Adhaeribacter swui]